VPNVNFAVLSFAVCKGDYPVNQGIKSFWCHWSPSFGNEHERGLLLMAKVIRTVKERPGEILGMRDMKVAGRICSLTSWTTTFKYSAYFPRGISPSLGLRT
jgi:hypothetical protein